MAASEALPNRRFHQRRRSNQRWYSAPLWSVTHRTTVGAASSKLRKLAFHQLIRYDCFAALQAQAVQASALRLMTTTEHSLCTAALALHHAVIVPRTSALMSMKRRQR